MFKQHQQLLADEKTNDNALSNLDAERLQQVNSEQLNELRAKYEVACQSITDLEEQLQYLREENNALKSKMAKIGTHEELHSVHDEFAW